MNISKLLFISKKRASVFANILSITLFTSLFFTNCYNVGLITPLTQNSEAPPQQEPVPEPLSLPQEEPAQSPQSPEIAPTVTESQCDAYHASNPVFQDGQQPAIYFLCDKLVFPANGSPTRSLDLVVSPNMYIDFAHHTILSRLHQRILANDPSVQGLSLNWWVSAGAPALVTNPADPFTRMVQAPSAHNAKFTVFFQVLKGNDAGLIHKVNFTVHEVNTIQAVQNVSCPGFTSTLNILPYTDLASDEYFTASHGFVDGSTAVVMPIKIPAGTRNLKIYYFNPYSEDWVYHVNLSTRPCDFGTNAGTVYNAGSSEFNLYTTDLPRDLSGNPVSSNVNGIASRTKADANRTYYLNMRVPICPLAADGRQRNCYSAISFVNAGSGVPLNYVDEFRGVLVLNGANQPPRYPSWSGIQPTR